MTSEISSYHSFLWDLGIEEVEPQICEDSFDNRRILRGAKVMWQVIFDHDDGQPTGLIRALTPEELTERRESVWDDRKPIMVDPDNQYSDYVGPDQLAMDANVPWWVKIRLRYWIEAALEGKPNTRAESFPIRCEVIRTDGTRCWSWAGNPKKVRRCKKHMAWEMDSDKAAAKLAKLRIMQMSPAAADTLEGLMLDPNESGAVRLKASTEILDRAGVRGGVEFDIRADIAVTNPADQVKERLSVLSERLTAAIAIEAAESPVDAELVEDEETPDDAS